MDEKDIINEKAAIEVLKRIDCPHEWREMFYRSIQFFERVIECIEERKKINKAING